MRTLATEFINKLSENGIVGSINTAMTGSIYIKTNYGSIRIADHLANSHKDTSKYNLSGYDSIDFVLDKILKEKNNIDSFKSIFKNGDIITNGFADFEVKEKTENGLVLKNLKSGNLREETNPFSLKVYKLKNQ